MASLAEELITRSNDSDVRERRAAASGLGKVRSRVPEDEFPFVAERLTELLRDHDPGVRRRAAFSLGKLNDLIPEEQIDLVVDGLLSMFGDPDSYVRSRVASAIGNLAGRIPDEKLADVAKAFRSLLMDGHPGVRDDTKTNLVKLMHRFSDDQMASITELFLSQSFDIAPGRGVDSNMDRAFSLARIAERIPEKLLATVICRLVELSKKPWSWDDGTATDAIKTLVKRLPEEQWEPVMGIHLNQLLTLARRGRKLPESSGLWGFVDIIPETHMRTVARAVLKLSKSWSVFPRWIGADYLGRLAGHIEGRELQLTVLRLTKMSKDRDKRVRIQARASLEKFETA